MAKALDCAIVLTAFAVMFGTCLLPSCDSAPHDLVASVPLGSKLAELDRYLDRARSSTGDVKGAIASKVPGGEPTPVDADYDDWGINPEQRAASPAPSRFITSVPPAPM